MFCFFSQQKQRCPALEELLVDLIVVAMERSEENEASMSETSCQLLWHHLSSHLIFFVLFQFASFPHMVLSLYTKVLIFVMAFLPCIVIKICNFLLAVDSFSHLKSCVLSFVINNCYYMYGSK